MGTRSVPGGALTATSEVRDGLWTMLETVVQEPWANKQSVGHSKVSSNVAASRGEVTTRTGTDHGLRASETMKSPFPGDLAMVN